MTTHQSTTPPLAARYFGPESHTREGHPIIVEVFRPGRGWTRSGWLHKRVSTSALRKLRKDGVTFVALGVGRRVADFSIAELLGTDKRDRRP